MSFDGSRIVIADLPVTERPRERLARQGPESLADTELLAILIGTGRPGRSSLDLARELASNGLTNVLQRRVAGVGPAARARIGAAMELGRRVAAARASNGEPLSDSLLLGQSLILRYADERQEHFGAIFLDSRNRIIRDREIYIGSLASANVSTRDVFRYALEYSAVSVIVFHNHPSGDPTPSAEDVAFTRTLIAAGNLVGVVVVDHIVIAAATCVSLKRMGLI